jgi:hypothetical protein
MKSLVLAVGLTSILSVTVLAQGPPNDPSFVKLADLYGSSNSGNYQTTQEVLLPTGFKLDRSYHQASVICCGGGATSRMRASEIPAGIHISPSGGLYWSVPGAPTLVPAEVSDDDRVLRWKLLVPMYCGPEPPRGCNVNVGVWAKRKQ